MKPAWTRVNPDTAVDRLPQPYRLINKVVEEIVEAVSERVGEIEAQKRSVEYEFSLQRALPTSSLMISARISCAYVEPRGTARLAFGTSSGDVIIVDAKTQQVVAQTHAFDETEPVTCVALCSDGIYQALPERAGVDPQPPLKRSLKVMAAGVSTPRVLIYDIEREQYGAVLKPACCVHIERSKEEEEEELERPIIEQLHCKGTNGAIWVVVLLYDRSIRAYLVPLGVPEVKGAAEGETNLANPILEGEEEDEAAEGAGDGEAGGAEEWAACVHIRTPTYSFSLVSMAPMPSLKEPELESLTLSVFSPRPDLGLQLGRGVATGQLPTHIFVSTVSSNVVVAYSLRAPGPIRAKPGLDAEALLNEVAPPPGTLPEPGPAQDLAPRRRWMLPAKTSAVAVSPNGAIVAVGGVKGAIALINAVTGPSLQAMLPGHYAGVLSLAFYRADLLVSVGADGYVHHYSMVNDSLVARYMSAPPPTPAPVTGLAVSQTMHLGLTLDASGNMRLIDLKRGRKIATASAFDLSEKASKNKSKAEAAARKAAAETADVAADVDVADAAEQGHEAAAPAEDEAPRLLLPHSFGFAVLCMNMGDAGVSQAPDGSQEHVGEEGGDEGAGPSAVERSWLVFFDQATVLKRLFPSIGGRAGKGEDVGQLFATMTQEELVKLMPQGLPSTMEKAILLSKKLPPPDPNVAARLAAQEAALAAATPGRSPLRSPTSRKTPQSRSRSGTPNSMILKLTAENLRKLAMQSQYIATLKRASSSMGSGGVGGSSQGGAAQAGGAPKLHAIQANWQASVKTELKEVLAHKDTRRSRLQKRIEQLRKEVAVADA